ncbi:MAG: PorT family protein [Flammeovirgaceae bacterium]|nr:PorT family protein [Flammeovirgaceae bacterium]
MKKNSLILLILLVPFSMFAQGVGIGIKGGANFANMAIKDVSSESITDFHIGAYVNLNVSDKFGITPEILYSAQGSKVSNATVNTDYFTFPVMLRWKPISLISLEAGPQFSFLSSAKKDGVDFKDQLKNNDFGAAVGAGLHLPLGFNGGVRYVMGFTNISDVSTMDIKNRTLQIYVGWTIFGAK